ncbi:MAG: phosphatidylglycerol lysyltransferase domain-containing protein [Lachnospiraceae bacterium]|nr:phosphatidylglycerol lysyltransferase domain-containing protein [Lachnospiraceae bacterium]
MSKYELKELRYEDYWEVRKLFALRYAETCENIITNSYIWKDYYEARYITDGEGLFWIYKLDGEYFTASPVCSDENIEKYFLMAKDYFHQELHQKLIMYTVDEKLVKQLGLPEEQYLVEEDRRYFDYVYDADALRNLSGKKYHKKKNHINAFHKEYDGRYECRVMTAKDSSMISEYLDRWHAMRDIEDDYHRDDYELRGIKELITHADDINMDMFGVLIDGQLEAFTLGTYLKREETAYIHVEKANPDIRGLYPFVNQQFLIKCFPTAKRVNREDDMGLEGLRKAKMSYNPIYMAKKYNVFEK